MNELLLPLQRQLEAGCEAPRKPVVFILGCPRSGSTLMSQLLAASGAFGYVSNFVARFWLAPAVGATIARATGIVENGGPSQSFSSYFGRTESWSEPHEFGFFWSRWFDRGQDTHIVSADDRARIDGAALRRTLASLEAVYDAAMAFKNNTWFTLQGGLLARLVPNSIVVVCRREPLYAAQSLIKGRRALFGSEKLFYGIRTSRYADLLALPPSDQVVVQVLEIEREMDAELATVPRDRIIDVPYLELCRDPRGMVERVRNAAAVQGRALPPSRPLPEKFRPTNEPSLAGDEWRELLDAARRHIPDFREPAQL